MVDKSSKKSSNLFKTRQLGVFEVADYDSEFRFWKFKIADPICHFMSFYVFNTEYEYVCEVAEYKTEPTIVNLDNLFIRSYSQLTFYRFVEKRISNTNMQVFIAQNTTE